MKKAHYLSAILLCVSTVSGVYAQVDTLTILHFNDTHSALAPIGPRNANLEGTIGGIARAATLVQSYRRTAPNVLLLHAGDAAIGDVFYNTTFGVAELQLMLSMGFDAMTLGNHEFDLTPSTLFQSVGAAFAEGSFPLLSANLVLADSTLQPLKQFISPYMIKKYGNSTVGIFGLTTPATNTLSSPSPAFVDTNVIVIAAAMVDTLIARECDVVICLSHLGVGLDQLLASYVPGIDVIIGGHDHLLLDRPLTVMNPLGKPTIIVQANAFYLNMGVLQLGISHGEVHLLTYQMERIDDRIMPDPTVAAVVSQLETSVEATFGPMFTQKIADASAEIAEVAQSLELKGSKDTPVGNLVADAFRAATGTDIALEVGGSTASQLWKGPIVADDIFRMVGYGFNTDNGLGYRLATFTMSGEALLAGLQFGLTTSAQDKNDEFLAQVSGMTYQYACKQTSSGTSFNLVGAMVGNQPLDPAKTYSVTANEFVPMFLSFLGLPIEDVHVFSDTTEYQVVTGYVTRLGTLHPVVEGRVTCVQVTAAQPENRAVPESFSLSQNYPNPFNPTTTIAFNVPQPCVVRVAVYNILGQEVSVLLNEFTKAGSYKIRFDASRLPSGAYFYSLKARDFAETKRMMLVK